MVRKGEITKFSGLGGWEILSLHTENSGKRSHFEVETVKIGLCPTGNTDKYVPKTNEN